jgi:predicted ATPase
MRSVQIVRSRAIDDTVLVTRRLGRRVTEAARFARHVQLGRELAVRGRAAEAARIVTEALVQWCGQAYNDRRSEAIAVECGEPVWSRKEVSDALRTIDRLSQALADWEGAFPHSPYGEQLIAELVQARVAPGPAHTAFPHPRSAVDLLSPRSAERVSGWPISSFVGREGELRTLATTLATRRMVTVIGPPGVGKTRLVAELLTCLPAGERPQLVRLAELNSPELLLPAVADAVGVRRFEHYPRTSLIEALATHSELLVLDNCEHLVNDVAELAVEVLASSPTLHILATGREPLGLDGEVTLPIEPLAATDQDGSDGPAMVLLLDRIRSIRGGWVPSEQERRAVRDICTSLDGLPLALELAAARAKVLGLVEISERLDDRFSLLGVVARGSVNPHSTLRAAIGWSVGLLEETERALLFQLWPFEQGFTLEMAEAARPSGTSVIDSLSALVARSMVVADTAAAPARYRLLHTVRAYCREHAN